MAIKSLCPSCDSYQRKIKETEFCVSSKNVLIEMLQGEVRKIEDLYKNLVDDYEKLRFAHCSGIQELGNYKQTCKQLENENTKIVKEKKALQEQLNELFAALDQYKSICEDLQNQLSTQNDCSCKQSGSEINDLRALIKTQNNSLKETLGQLIKELQNKPKTETGVCKQDTTCQASVPQYFCTAYLNQKSKPELVGIIDSLEHDREELTKVILKLQKENEHIETTFSSKRDDITACLEILQKNDADINHLCQIIEAVISERDNYSEEIKRLQEFVDQNQCKQASSHEDELRNQLEQVNEENEKLRQSIEYRRNRETLMMQEISDNLTIIKNNENNKSLEEKLNAVTEERDKNLETIAQLTRQLNELKESYAPSNQQVIKELEEAKLEIAEYEEENRCYCQKIVSLQKELHNVEEEKLRLCEDNEECTQRIDKIIQECTIITREKDESIKNLTEEVNVLKRVQDTHRQENEELRKKLKSTEQDKLYLGNQLTQLNNELSETTNATDIKLKLLQDKLEKLEKEDRDKQLQLNTACKEIEAIQQKIDDENEAKSKYSDYSNKIETRNALLDSENKKLRNDIECIEKQNKQYRDMINELKAKLSRMQNMNTNIDAIAAENLSLRHDYIEKTKEIDDLKQSLMISQNLERSTDIAKETEELNEKLQKLESELWQKQCIISNLEECIDRSNVILLDCEREIKEIMHENEYLKHDLEELRKLKPSTEEIPSTISNTGSVRHVEVQCDCERKEIKDKITRLSHQYSWLLAESKQKDTELEMIKKQFDLLRDCCKPTDETELQKLRKDSKIIKDMLLNTKQNPPPVNIRLDCDTTMLASTENYIKELETKIVEKDDRIRKLQGLVDALTTKNVTLNKYVNDVTMDNKNLKVAIATLLNTIVAKLKNSECRGYYEDICLTDTLADDILISLNKMQNNVNDSKRQRCCENIKCNCMSEITSKYIDLTASDDSIKVTRCCPCSKEECDLTKPEGITRKLDTKESHRSGKRVSMRDDVLEIQLLKNASTNEDPNTRISYVSTKSGRSCRDRKSILANQTNYELNNQTLVDKTSEDTKMQNSRISTMSTKSGRSFREGKSMMENQTSQELNNPMLAGKTSEDTKMQNSRMSAMSTKSGRSFREGKSMLENQTSQESNNPMLAGKTSEDTKMQNSRMSAMSTKSGRSCREGKSMLENQTSQELSNQMLTEGDKTSEDTMSVSEDTVSCYSHKSGVSRISEATSQYSMEDCDDCNNHNCSLCPPDDQCS